MNPSPENPEIPRIAFVHIPKCGGQSIQHRLAEYYGEEACLRVGKLKFGGDILSEAPDDDWRTALRQARVIYGHYTWSFLKAVIERTSSPRFTPLCVVREPLERAISEFFYIREYPEHPQWGQCQELTLVQYLLDHHQHNCQCHFISGTPLFGETQIQVEQDFEAICPIDELDSFSKGLAGVLGLPVQAVPHLNQSSKSSEERRVGPRTASRFYEKNVADLRLFWWVTENWRHQWRFGGRLAELETREASA